MYTLTSGSRKFAYSGMAVMWGPGVCTQMMPCDMTCYM